MYAGCAATAVEVEVRKRQSSCQGIGLKWFCASNLRVLGRMAVYVNVGVRNWRLATIEMMAQGPPTFLRVLFVEDSPDDVELIRHELARHVSCIVTTNALQSHCLRLPEFTMTSAKTATSPNFSSAQASERVRGISQYPLTKGTSADTDPSTCANPGRIPRRRPGPRES